MSLQGGRATSFVRQAALLAAASLFVRFMGFLYRIPLTNFLIGDEGNAFYSIAYQFYTSALIISSAALPAAVSKLVSERMARGQYRNAHEMFKTAMICAVIFSSVTGLFIWLGAERLLNFFDFPHEALLAVRIFAPTLIIVGILAAFRGYFQGMKTALPTALSQVIEQIFNVFFTILLAFIFFDAANMEYAVAGMAAGTTIGAVAGVAVVAWLFSLVAGDYKGKARTDMNFKTFESRGRQMAAIVRTALPIVISMGIFSAGNFIDLGMATNRLEASGAFSEDEINIFIGQFTGKFILLTTLPVALSLALSAAVIPEISTSQVKMDTKAIRHKTNTALRLSMILSIPAAVGLGVLADPIIELLFPNHPDGGWLLRYGAVSIVFLAIVHILTGVLQGIGHVGTPAIGAFFGVLVKIPVNYYLMAVPQINILGAVISTIMCYVVATVLNLFFLRRYTGILPSLGGAIGKPLAASAVMGVVVYAVYYIGRAFIPYSAATVAALTIGMLVYLVFMLLIKGFRSGDIDAVPMPGVLRRLFRR